MGVCLFPIWLFGVVAVNAQTEVERLQTQIKEKNERLAEIEREIAEFESALTEVGAEKDTLQRAIDQLNLERQKVQSDIKYTENRIDNTDLEINKLSIEIGDTESEIDRNEAAIGEILRSLNTSDDESMVEIFLRHENLSEFWNEVEGLETVRTSMSDRVQHLLILKDSLEGKRSDETQYRAELVTLRRQFTGQRAVLDNNKREKDTLLAETENEEAQYQAQLAAKNEAREQILREVREIESELQFILDPNKIPEKGTAVFDWPVANVRITQYFGYTRFALSGAYSGNAHNGVDFGAPTGTTIFAPLSGTVRAVGNTDSVPGCYSWGKWLLIDHPNGLSTLYAHLSHIGVSNGERVNTGDVIGFVGNTGYSTGPHLHFTVYVSEAVQVRRFNQFKAVTSCGAALSPFAAVEGYLNPLDYLPTP